MSLIVKVYEYTSDGSLGVPVQRWTDEVEGLRFATKNPGGFIECTFRVNMPYGKAVTIYGEYHHYRMIITGGSGDVAWDGRIEDITAEPGQINIVGQGYWSNAFDNVYDDGTFILAPAAENGLNELDGYAVVAGNYQRLAQSFQIDPSRALMDIQLNIVNFGVKEGTITVSLRNDNSGEPGTIVTDHVGGEYVEIKRVFDVSGLESGGFSEYLGLPTNNKLSANTTYWILVEGDGPYFRNTDSGSGTDNSGTSGHTYLYNSSTDFVGSGVVVGTLVENTTDGTEAPVTSIELSNLLNPTNTAWWRYWSGDDDLWVEVPELKDGNPSTFKQFAGWDDEQWIMIGRSAGPFGGININMADPDYNQQKPGKIRVQYVTGGWLDLEIVEDGTSVDGITLNQDGSIRWKIPSQWAQEDVGPRDGREMGYFIRFGIDGEMAGSLFRILDVKTGWNCKLNFESLTFDNGDGYSFSVGVAVGIDTDASYTSGKLMYYNNGTWYDYSPSSDAIFYIWTHGRFYYTDGADSYSSDVIEDAVANCHHINDTTGYFEDVGRVVNPIRFSSGEKPGDVIEKMVMFGSSDAVGEPMFFGVYEDRNPIFRKLADGNRWIVDAKNIPIGQQAMAMTSSLDGMRTRVGVLYSDAVGSRALTPWVENTDLYYKFGYHRDGIFSIAGTIEDIAVDLSEELAAIYNKPSQSLELLIDGYVQDSSGRNWPAWKVRAGDIIVLRNLIPPNAMVTQATVDNLSTVYVQETEFDAETNRLRVTPSDRQRGFIDVLLMLAGLQGGSLL